MSEKEIWFVPLPVTRKSYPDDLTTKLSYNVEFPSNTCCACGGSQPAMLEELEFREELALSSLPLLFPYKKEIQLSVEVPICRECAEKIKGKDKWSVPWKKLGALDRIKARRKLTKLIQVNIPSQHPQWLKVTLPNKKCSVAFKAANPSARRML